MKWLDRNCAQVLMLLWLMFVAVCFALPPTFTVPSTAPQAQSQAASDITSGLVGWWKFVSDATDSSGNGLDGTLNGNAAVSGGQLALDGTGDYMNAGNSTTLNPAAITVEAWVNFSSLAPTYTAAVSRAGTYYYQILVKSNGKLAVYMSAAGGVSYDGTGSTTLTTGVQYALTLTYSTTDGLRMYVNGVEDKAVAANGAFSAEAANFTVGRDAADAARDMSGTVPEVRVYSVALSAADVLTLYNNGPK